MAGVAVVRPRRNFALLFSLGATAFSVVAPVAGSEALAKAVTVAVASAGASAAPTRSPNDEGGTGASGGFSRVVSEATAAEEHVDGLRARGLQAATITTSTISSSMTGTSTWTHTIPDYGGTQVNPSGYDGTTMYLTLEDSGIKRCYRVEVGASITLAELPAGSPTLCANAAYDVSFGAYTGTTGSPGSQQFSNPTANCNGGPLSASLQIFEIETTDMNAVGPAAGSVIIHPHCFHNVYIIFRVIDREAGCLLLDVENNDGTIQGGWASFTFNGNYFLHDAGSGKGMKHVIFPAPAGLWSAQLEFPLAQGASDNVPVTVTQDGVPYHFTVDQATQVSFALGTFLFSSGDTVTVSNTGTSGFVIVDALRFCPATTTTMTTDTSTMTTFTESSRTLSSSISLTFSSTKTTLTLSSSTATTLTLTTTFTATSQTASSISRTGSETFTTTSLTSTTTSESVTSGTSTSSITSTVSETVTSTESSSTTRSTITRTGSETFTTSSRTSATSGTTLTHTTTITSHTVTDTFTTASSTATNTSTSYTHSIPHGGGLQVDPTTYTGQVMFLTQNIPAEGGTRCFRIEVGVQMMMASTPSGACLDAVYDISLGSFSGSHGAPATQQYTNGDGTCYNGAGRASSLAMFEVETESMDQVGPAAGSVVTHPECFYRIYIVWRVMAGALGCMLLDVEHGHATQQGSWTSFIHNTNHFLHDSASGKGSKSVTFTVPDGYYSAQLEYPVASGAASNIPVIVTEGGVSTTIYIDQSTGSTTWNLGTFQFTSQDTVTISNAGTTGFVLADALRLCPGTTTSRTTSTQTTLSTTASSSTTATITTTRSSTRTVSETSLSFSTSSTTISTTTTESTVTTTRSSSTVSITSSSSSLTGSSSSATSSATVSTTLTTTSSSETSTSSATSTPTTRSSTETSSHTQTSRTFTSITRTGSDTFTTLSLTSSTTSFTSTSTHTMSTATFTSTVSLTFTRTQTSLTQSSTLTITTYSPTSLTRTGSDTLTTKSSTTPITTTEITSSASSTTDFQAMHIFRGVVQFVISMASSFVVHPVAPDCLVGALAMTIGVPESSLRVWLALASQRRLRGWSGRILSSNCAQPNSSDQTCAVSASYMITLPQDSAIDATVDETAFELHLRAQLAARPAMAGFQIASVLSATSGDFCPSRIEVAGAEDVQSWNMGEFIATSVAPVAELRGRPIYVNSYGQYMYYWAPFLDWCIGSSYTNCDLQAVDDDEDACPTDAVSWSVWNGTHWSTAYSITVAEVITTTFTSTTLTSWMAQPSPQPSPWVEELFSAATPWEAAGAVTAVVLSIVAGCCFVLSCWYRRRRRRMQIHTVDLTDLTQVDPDEDSLKEDRGKFEEEDSNLPETFEDLRTKWLTRGFKSSLTLDLKEQPSIIEISPSSDVAPAPPSVAPIEQSADRMIVALRRSRTIPSLTAIPTTNGTSSGSLRRASQGIDTPHRPDAERATLEDVMRPTQSPPPTVAIDRGGGTLLQSSTSAGKPPEPGTARSSRRSRNSSTRSKLDRSGAMYDQPRRVVHVSGMLSSVSKGPRSSSRNASKDASEEEPDAARTG